MTVHGAESMPQARLSLSPARVALVVVLCSSLAFAGCRDREPKLPSTGDTPAAAPAATQSSGPLAGVAIPTPAVPAEAAPGTDQQQEEAAGPRFPAPNEGAELVRLVVPKARVNNRFVEKGLNARREMEDPGGKDVIAWYNFSTLPGFGSNAVLSGHVDWYTGERGVFWFLRDLKEGDEAEVHYSDGMVLKYRVTRVEVYGTNDAPVAEITGPTTNDMITMITCDGVFQRGTGDYTQRRVVWAERFA
jgi:LPXTG-site transpeptidase (sortase) family protein